MPNVSGEVPLNILGNMVTVAPGVSRPEPVVTFVSGVVNTSEGLSTMISGSPLNTTTLHSQSVVTPIVIGQHLMGSPQQSGLKRPFPRGAQTPGGIPAKVRVLGSTIEGLTAPTDPSLPVTVNIARFLQTYPSQAPTPGVASYLDTGGSQPQMVFTHAPMGTPQLLRVIGTLHHPASQPPTSILGGSSVDCEQHPRIPAPPPEGTSTMPLREEDDIRIIQPPAKRTVYVVVDDDEEDTADQPVVDSAQIKQEGTSLVVRLGLKEAAKTQLILLKVQMRLNWMRMKK